MTPDTDRQAKSRERKRALGLVQVAIWILPGSKPAVQAIVENDRRKAESENHCASLELAAR